MYLSRAGQTISGQQVGSFSSVAATTMTANTGTISGVAHLTTIMGTGISDSLVLASSTTAASAAAVSNCWAGCVHTSGGVVNGTLGVSNLNVLGTLMTVNATEVVSSNMVVNNYGTGPALSVTQSETGVFGAQPVATFNAGSNVVLVIDNNGNLAVGKAAASYALDVSGVVSATSFVGSGALLTGISSGGGSGAVLKNFVINGDMMINQRKNKYSATWGSSLVAFNQVGSTGSSESSSTYVVDRFCVFRNSYAGGSLCMQGICSMTAGYATSVLPFQNAGLLYYAAFGRISGDTGTAAINMRYGFDMLDSLQFFGKPVTLSFYYQTGATFSGSSLSCGFITAYGGSPGSYMAGSGSLGLQRGQASVMNTQGTTFSPSTSWVYTSFTTTLPAIVNWTGSSATIAGIYFSYTPSGTAGTTDYVNITGVQVEMGSSATSFEMCPYATKLNMCQRYYQQLPINYCNVGMGGGVNSGSSLIPIILSPPMRLTNGGTMVLLQTPYSVGNEVCQLGSSYNVNTGAFTITIATATSVWLNAPCSALSSYTGPIIFYISQGFIGFSAEV